MVPHKGMMAPLCPYGMHVCLVTCLNDRVLLWKLFGIESTWFTVNIDAFQVGQFSWQLLHRSSGK